MRWSLLVYDNFLYANFTHLQPQFTLKQRDKNLI